GPGIGIPVDGPEVPPPPQLLPPVRRHHPRSPPEERLPPAGGEDVPPPVPLHLRVLQLRVYRESRVRNQRPRRRRPDEEVATGLAFHLHRQVERGVLHVAIPERHLVARQTRPTPGAVRQDLVTAIEQPAFRDLLQTPPDRLDVRRVVRDVRARVVQPVTDPRGEPLPLLGIGEHT